MHPIAALALILSMAGGPTPGSGGPFRLLADLNRTEVLGSTAGEEDVLEAGGLVFFKAVADRPVRRGQLWRTDGTGAGTRLLAEFSGVEAGGMAELNGRVLLGARTWSHGHEPWITDGTPAGTMLLSDLAPGPQGSHPQRFLRMGDSVYFVTVEDSGRQLGRLYRTDGTAAGTHCVLSCGGETPGIVAQPLAVIGDVLYLARVSGAAHELWRSDGTAEGSWMVRAFAFGPVALRAAGQRVTFAADDGLRGLEPWTSDGTFDGTRLVRDIRPGRFGSMDLSAQAVLDGVLLLTANDGSRGQELWRSDGTEAGTSLVLELNPGAQGSHPHRLTVLGEHVVFLAGTGPQGADVWRTDGTAAGTSRIHAVPSDAPRPAEAPGLAIVGDSIHFAGWDAAHGWEPWRSDGTIAGTSLLADILPGPGSSLAPGAHALAAAGPRLLLFADDGLHGREPWTSDGTPEGTRLLLDANPLRGTADAWPRALAAAGSRLVFASLQPEALLAADGSAVRQLTAAGEFGAASCHDQAAAAHLFALACPPHLWVTDGEPGGTLRGTDLLQASAGDSDVILPAPLRDRILFVLDGDAMALAITDGSPDGTLVLREFPRMGDERPVALGATALFGASDGSGGRELWRTDGTPAGTEAVLDLNPGPAEGNPSQLTLLGTGHALFRAGDGLHGSELWITDGTAAGTRLVRDLTPGGEGTSFTLAAPASSAREAWLVASRGVESRLWKTDGTEQGTVPVGPVFTGGSNRPHELVRAGSLVHFVSGSALWVTDGSDEGTLPVREFPEPPRALVARGGIVLFAAGLEDPPLDPRDIVWRSDGTGEGTLPVQPLVPVAWRFGLDRETAFVPAGTHLYLTADDGVHGEELWWSHAAVAAGDIASALADLDSELAAAGLAAGILRGLRARLDAARLDAVSPERRLALRPFIQGVLALPASHIPPEAARHLAQFAEDIERMAAALP